MSHWKDRITGQGKESPDQLLANPNNWRKHPKHQQEALKGVLEDIGWIQQVIVNQTTGHLIDGHLRVELSRREGETEVPVIYVDLTEEEEKLALATIDPLSALAETDQVMLDQLIADIDTDNEQLNELLNSLSTLELLDEPTEGLTDDDDVPDVQNETVSREGDIWLLGDHRLMCGDSTNLEHVDRLVD
ncbi:MAG: ParB/RepB/Spo0J family partition protein, partial [Candidatus Sedimenticola endophacoides]